MKRQHTSSDIEIVESVGVIELGGIYTIQDGASYDGRKIVIDYISPNKQIYVKGKMCRQAHGRLLNSSTKINVVLELLKEYIDSKKPNYKKFDNLKIIKLCKKNDKNAITEFVRRFKKLPKINVK